MRALQCSLVASCLLLIGCSAHPAPMPAAEAALDWSQESPDSLELPFNTEAYDHIEETSMAPAGWQWHSLNTNRGIGEGNVCHWPRPATPTGSVGTSWQSAANGTLCQRSRFY
jgi:hypothetical protein